MLDSLNKIKSLYTDKYLTVDSSQGIYTAQKDKLVYILNDLQKQINTKNDTIATYERELQDRNAVSTPFTFWRVRGISTLQDWVILVFFIIYGLICVFLMIIALQSDNAGYNFALILLSSLSMGVLLMGIIVRFA